MLEHFLFHILNKEVYIHCCLHEKERNSYQIYVTEMNTE